jgi:hypothetical protein
MCDLTVCTLKVQKTNEWRDYEYMPYSGCGYYFDSQNPKCDDFLMVIYDENFTILNDIYDN